MREWLATLAGAQYVDAILWTAAALVLLVLILAVVKFAGRMNSGTFVAGGRNRRTRLAVMDATAIDSQRRLVLVRRDDVEHLLLIGGPSDVVVEQDIRVMAQRRPVPAEGTRPPPPPEGNMTQAPLPPQVRPGPQAPPRPQPDPLAGAARYSGGADRAARAPSAEPRRPSEPPRPQPGGRLPPPPEPRLVPPASRSAAPRASTTTPPALQPARPQRVEPPPPDSIDEQLMNELDIMGDDTPAAKSAKPQPSLDDEMARLLGELSNPRR